MAQAYFSLVTNTGKIKLAQSAAGGDPVVITHFAIGDGNGAETNPTAANAALVREVWRTPVESVVTDPDNPSAILVTAIIPTNAGGWWMREFGIFDQAGSMIAVAKPVSQYKPTALEGQLEDIRYEFQIIIGENANVTLLVDPSLLFATRTWVENRKIPMGQLMRLPWMPVLSITLSSAPGNPAVGDTYLVPSNATGVWTTNTGKIAEWNGSGWNYVSPPDGHGISLPDGRVFERIAGSYIEKLALDAQSGKWTYAVGAGTSTAITASLSPAPPSYADVKSVILKVPAFDISENATLNLNGLGALPIVKMRGGAIRKGDIPPNTLIGLFCDGTRFLFTGLALSEVPSLALGDLTFYVRPDGNDNNTGLENNAGGAFRQIQAALSAVSRYTLLGYVAYIRVADGTYDAFVATNTGGADIRVIGNIASPGNVIINGGTRDAIVAIRSTLYIDGMRINAPASGKMCILSFDRSNISFSRVIFGAAGLSHMYASGSSMVRATGNYSIAGSALNHILAGTTSSIDITGVSATITAAVSFNAFVEANNGTILAAGSGFPGAGSVTGARYLAQVVGVIYTAGGGANYFAGSTSGSVVTGGVYI